MKLIKLFLVALATISFSANSLANDWSKIRVGTEGAYAPFNYIDSDGELKGFDVEIARALYQGVIRRINL